MNKKNNINSDLNKKICYFLSSLLVSTKHKIEFKKYISTRELNEDTAIELYDNLLYNLQRKFSMTTWMTFIMIFCFIAPWFELDDSIAKRILLLSILSMPAILIISYYPLRIIINMIYPKKYKNGSKKNYHLHSLFFLSTQEEIRNIKTYIPSKPLEQKIGSYLPWECPKCKKTNLIANRICSKCNFEHYWKCQKCDTLNISNNILCIKCNLKKGESDYLEETWECPKCQEAIEKVFTECWKCTK